MKRIRLVVAVALVLFIPYMAIAAGQSATTSGPVEIQMVLPTGDFEGDEMNVNSFMEAFPDIKVSFIAMPGEIEQYMSLKAAADEVPDVFGINPNSFGADLADRGIVGDIGHTKVWKNLLPGSKLMFTSPGGKRFGIPPGVATMLYYYRLDTFEKYNLEVPTNWEEFLDVCETLKENGEVPIISQHAGALLHFGTTFGQNVVPKFPKYIEMVRGGTFDFDIPEVADAFGRSKILFEAGYFQEGYVGTEYTVALSMYLQGKGVMHFNGNWLSGDVFGEDAPFESGAFVPPYNHEGEEMTPVVGSETGYGVKEQTGSKREASESLLEWWFGDGYEFYQNRNGKTPAFIEPVGNMKLAQAILDALATIGEAEKSGNMGFEFMPSEAYGLIGTLLDEVILGIKTPAEAARALGKAAKEAVADE